MKSLGDLPCLAAMKLIIEIKWVLRESKVSFALPRDIRVSENIRVAEGPLVILGTVPLIYQEEEMEIQSSRGTWPRRTAIGPAL